MRYLRAAVLVLAACANTYADDEPTHFGHDHDTLVRFHMHENYALYGAIERLLVHNKLADARDLARAIAIAPDEIGLQAWTRRTATVRERAQALADATTIDDAARAAAGLVEACARCHVDTNAVPALRSPPPLPADRPDVDTRMTRHIWAVERIRDGVVSAVDDSWRAGLDVLAEAPLPWPREDTKRATFAKQIHTLASDARARKTDGLAERARTYGTILVTCAGCHSLGNAIDAAARN